MKIVCQTSDILVLKAPAWPYWIVSFILALPGLLVLTLFVLLGGLLDYTVLTCDRSHPPERQCQFLRISLVRPVRYQFPVEDLKGVTLDRANLSQSQNQFRTNVEIAEKSIPLTIYFSSDGRREYEKIKTKIQSYLEAPARLTLTLRIWPHWFSIVLLPISAVSIGIGIGFGAISAACVTCCFDRVSRQVTISIKRWFASQIQQYSFDEIDRIEIDIVESRPHRNRTPTVRYQLNIRSNEGHSLWQFNYLDRIQVEATAELIREVIR